MRYRQINFDGCNGWRLGDVIEATPDENGTVHFDGEGNPCDAPSDDEDASTFFSRNDDGLLEPEDGYESLLIPID